MVTAENIWVTVASVELTNNTAISKLNFYHLNLRVKCLGSSRRTENWHFVSVYGGKSVKLGGFRALIYPSLPPVSAWLAWRLIHTFFQKNSKVKFQRFFHINMSNVELESKFWDNQRKKITFWGIKKGQSLQFGL